MDYELIIKFYRPSLADESIVAVIEGELKTHLGAGAETDGFDTTAKEINLFIRAADPRATFRKAKSVLERHGIERGVSAAYRLVGGAQLTSIWPLRPMRRFSMP